MKSIHSLIKLDYYNIKPLMRIIVVAMIISTTIGAISNPGMIIMVILTFLAFLLNIGFAIGEKNNFNKLYGILPVKKVI